jgi:hypothetical protein
MDAIDDNDSHLPVNRRLDRSNAGVQAGACAALEIAPASTAMPRK